MESQEAAESEWVDFPFPRRPPGPPATDYFASPKLLGLDVLSLPDVARRLRIVLASIGVQVGQDSAEVYINELQEHIRHPSQLCTLSEIMSHLYCSAIVQHMRYDNEHMSDPEALIMERISQSLLVPFVGQDAGLLSMFPLTEIVNVMKHEPQNSLYLKVIEEETKDVAQGCGMLFYAKSETHVLPDSKPVVPTALNAFRSPPKAELIRAQDARFVFTDKMWAKRFQAQALDMLSGSEFTVELMDHGHYLVGEQCRIFQSCPKKLMASDIFVSDFATLTKRERLQLAMQHSTILYVFLVGNVVCKMALTAWPGHSLRMQQCHILAAAAAERTRRWLSEPQNHPKTFSPSKLPHVAQCYYTPCLRARLAASANVSIPSCSTMDCRDIDELVAQIEGEGCGSRSEVKAKKGKRKRGKGRLTNRGDTHAKQDGGELAALCTLFESLGYLDKDISQAAGAIRASGLCPTEALIMEEIEKAQALDMECPICFQTFSVENPRARRPCCGQMICQICDEACSRSFEGCVYCRQ